MTAELMTAIAVAPAVTFGATALGLLWWASWRERRSLAGVDRAPELAPARVDLRDPCPGCGGRHCPGCDAPARITATRRRRYTSRHGQEEIPPSILVPALAMDVVARARELCRQLGAGRPALDLRTRVALAPTAWAARLGRPVQLAGCAPRTAVLP